MNSLCTYPNEKQKIRISKDHRYRCKFTILKEKLSERGRLGIANSLILLNNYGGQDQSTRRSYSPGEVRCMFGINNITCVPEYSSLDHVSQVVCDPEEWRIQESNLLRKVHDMTQWNNETEQFNRPNCEDCELMLLYGIRMWPFREQL